MTPLAGMAAHVARRVEKLKAAEPVAQLRVRPFYAREAHDPAVLLIPGVRVAEVKFADPDAGLLVPRESATAEEAARRAAAAVSDGCLAAGIWVERNFHAGDYAHLEAARSACPRLFLIARDLVIDAWQLERARAAGADGVELSAELLGPALPAVAKAARDLGLTPVLWGPGPTVSVVTA